MPVTHGVASSSLVRTANKREKRFRSFRNLFCFSAFLMQKIWLFASCSVRRPPDYRQSKSVYYELCQITERFYAKSPNSQIIAYFCRCEHFEIKYLYIQCYSADSLLAQIVLFISQKPFRLPFLRSIMPFSVRLIVMVLTVLSDLPMCVAISFCVAFGRSCKKFSTAISSKVQFKVQILHFEVWFVKMCGDKGNQHGFWIAGFVGWLVFYIEII